MKKFFLVVSVVLLGILFTSCETNSGSGSTVYLCTGGSSTKYHFKSTCQGLSNCGGAIVSTSLSDAQAQGRTLCGFE